jgi:hypothetical protein
VIPIVRSLYEALGIIPRRGYKFTPSGPGSYIYSEGDHKLEIQREILLGKVHLVIYRGLTENHWMPPHEGEAISAEKMEEIFQRLYAFMDELHVRYEIED